ncbi:DUF3435 domain protein [Pleurostoma richardsiae]|uniref:DUF3435 domain protein n=1 Tax=Pleurostoma richardsiae TaxID=41990 RepID=A0AA38RYR7_9PEZI|nr:DUF3435 domain protein [Pleurostoma richardsiae]
MVVVHRQQKPPDHYRRRRNRYAEQGVVKKVHSDTTKVNMAGVTKKWREHCAHLDVDDYSHMDVAAKEDIMVFLEWMLDTYKRIRKRSTVHEYKRVFLMVYRKSVSRDFDKEASSEINDHINGYLTVTYALDTKMKEKPVMNVDDIYLILHHHWVLDASVFPDEQQRIGMALLLLLQAYTATRPRVLVYKPLNKNRIREHYLGWEDDDWEEEELEPEEINFKTLCYRDFNLFLLPNPEGGRDVQLMEVTLRYTKNYERRANPKTFVLYEVEDFIFDPTLLMVTMGFLDNAFDSDIRSVEEFYRVKVPPSRRSLEFRWKKEILDIPVFRQAVQTSDGLRTSPPIPGEAEALHYHTYLYYLQRLGLACGLMQILTAYMIRRGAGEAVEAVATQGQLQQVMCHINAAIYQAYINQKIQCDTVAAFLGRPSQKALMKSATHMSRYADPRAPCRPSQEKLEDIKTDPQLASLKELRDMLSQEVRGQSGSISAARTAGTEL